MARNLELCAAKRPTGLHTKMMLALKQHRLLELQHTGRCMALGCCGFRFVMRKGRKALIRWPLHMSGSQSRATGMPGRSMEPADLQVQLKLNEIPH